MQSNSYINLIGKKPESYDMNQFTFGEDEPT